MIVVIVNIATNSDMSLIIIITLNRLDIDTENDMICWLCVYLHFRFLDTLGTLFHFVTHDVKQKVDILEAYLKSDPENYSTINGTLKYEVEHNLTKTKVSTKSQSYAAYLFCPIIW